MVYFQVVQHTRKPVLLSCSVVILCPHNYCKYVKKKTPYYTYTYIGGDIVTLRYTTAKWAARFGLFLSNLIIESTAPLVLISKGIRMRNSNKIQNRRIQPAHRVDLGALVSINVCVFYRSLLPFYLFLTEQCRDRKDLDLDSRIFILHFTGLR